MKRKYKLRERGKPRPWREVWKLKTKPKPGKRRRIGGTSERKGIL